MGAFSVSYPFFTKGIDWILQGGARINKIKERVIKMEGKDMGKIRELSHQISTIVGGNEKKIYLFFSTLAWCLGAGMAAVVVCLLWDQSIATHLEGILLVSGWSGVIGGMFGGILKLYRE